jgi:thiol-activated cytolysin
MKKYLIPLFVFTILFSSCKKDEESTNTSTDSFAAVIESGGDFEPVTINEEVTSSEPSTEIIEGEVWNCTTTTYDALAAGGGNSGFPLFNPNASVIYPGSLIQGNSLRQATPNIIAVGRAGGTVSYDLNNGNLASFFEVDNVRKSSIQNAMNQIIANSPPDLPANFTFKYEQVQSEQALALELGIDYEGAFTEVSGDFGFSSNTSYNRYLVELRQSFYTMSFDIPTNDAGIYAPDVSPSDLAQFVGPGNPAAFISDVTYGRIYYMLIESSSSYTEMDAAITASFQGVTNSASADIDASYMSDLEELNIRVMAFGGEATSTLLTIGETDLSQLVNLLAESTTISTGLPISYVVRSVKSKQIVSVQLATQYDVTECSPATQSSAPPYTSHWAGNVLSAMGPVGAAFSGEGTEFYLINQAGDQYMVSNVGSLEGPFPISNLASNDPPFNIGAACRIDGNQTSESWTMVMDITGSQYSYLRSNGTWSTQVTPIANLATGDNPFSLNGIGAMLFRFKDPDGPSQRYMFNSDGTFYSLYSNNPNQFGNTSATELWAANYQMPFIVDKVSAGIGFFLGNNRYYILFNHTGTQYCVSGDVNGNGGNEFIGPFEL